MTAAVELQSDDHREILDIIDKLRAHGISRFVDLPEIVVCGDQSAGKSSVLEAISGMSFPTKDGLCTRFATELILRRDTHHSVKISITPGVDRNQADRNRLSEWKPTVSVEGDGLGQVIDSAMEAMGLAADLSKDGSGVRSSRFSKDSLRVELSGPTQPHLTMVDLPGIFRAGNSDQSADDGKDIEAMVRSYIQRPRCIILAVVSAKNDFANQYITQMARELDPHGKRTLGLITKPDTLDSGSDSEAFYVNLAQNRDVIFHLGWHVLKNRGYAEKEISLEQRNDAEQLFFSKRSVWANVPGSDRGASSLKEKLSFVLRDQILRQLPRLIQDVEVGLTECEGMLNKLGHSRSTISEQRRYLLHVSHEFSTLMKSAVDGVYSHPFFGRASTDGGYQKRLRAVVQNTLTAFRDAMIARGHKERIVDSASSVNSLRGIDEDPPKILRSDYIERVKELSRRIRGRELPGLFNPTIVEDLFSEQCSPWSGITTSFTSQIVKAVHTTIADVVAQVAIGETLAGIQSFVNDRCADFDTDLSLKVAELLHPHTNGHPITYNHYLTDTVQKVQNERLKKDRDSLLRAHGGMGGQSSIDGYRQTHWNPAPFLAALEEEQVERDLERYGSTVATDYMEAYYKVALKRFVDDVSVLAVEDCLIKQLPTIFDPQRVANMDDAEVRQLAAESDRTTAERTRYTEKRDILELGLRDLKRLGRYRAFSAVGDESYLQMNGSSSVLQLLTPPLAEDDSDIYEPKPLDPGIEEAAEPEVATEPEAAVEPQVTDLWGEFMFGKPSDIKKKKKKKVQNVQE